MINYYQWMVGNDCCCGEKMDCGCSGDKCDCDNILLEISQLHTDDADLQRQIDELSGSSIDLDELTAYTYDKETIDSKDNTLNYKIVEVSGKTDNVINEITALSATVRTISAETADFVDEEELSAFTYSKAVIDSKIASGGTFDPTAYYNKHDVDGLLEDKQDKLMSGTNIKTINNQSLLGSGNINIEGGGSVDAYTKAESDAKYATITNFNTHSGNTNIHVTSAEKAAWNAKPDSSNVYTKTEINSALANKQDTLTAGTGISINNNVVSAKIWSGTQSQYEALGTYNNDTLYLVY